MNPKQIATEEQETYLDSYKKNADRPENSLGGWDIRVLLGEIQDLDGPVQGYESTIPVLRSLRLCVHSRNLR